MGDANPGADANISVPSAPGSETRPHLRPYQEIVGRLNQLDKTGARLTVELDVGTLEYPVSSREATICEDRLGGREGQRVSILRTDSLDTPLRIRLLDSEA